jgi:hypothetical protein
MNRLTNRFTCEAMPDPDRRAFFTHTTMAAAAGVAAAAGLHAVPAKGATAATTPTADPAQIQWKRPRGSRPSRSRRAGAARSAR